MDKEFAELLDQLCSYTAVSGYENNLAPFIKTSFEKHCDRVEIDSFFNVIGLKKGFGSTGRKIMLTAHMDEIGFLVTGIDEKGFVRFSNIGGVDSKILLAQEVIIHGKNKINGVIGARPPHLLKAEESKKSVKLKDLAIDTGMSAQKLKESVSIGDIVTLKSTPLRLQNERFSSKAVDNRCSIAALIQVMQELTRVRHDSDVYFVATAQEEEDLSGVTAAAYNLQPDIAVVIDACHGDMPDTSKEDTYNLGKGPAIGIGPVLAKKLTNRLIEIAKEENIPYQLDVEPDDTGTEAWATQVSRCGIPTALVSIPVRYMHTSVETVHLDDIRNTGRLILRFVSKSGVEVEV